MCPYRKDLPAVPYRKPKKPKGTASSSPPEKLQKWTYDRGYGDYVYVLTFANDRLKRIETSGRGR